jgi:hypothetical protein
MQYSAARVVFLSFESGRLNHSQYGSFPTPGFTGMFQSADRGATWAPVNAGMDDLIANRAQVNALLVNPVNTNVLYLATTGYGVFKSSDAGATWAPYKRWPEIPRRGSARDQPPATSATVYAGTSGGVFQIVGDAATSSGPAAKWSPR